MMRCYNTAFWYFRSSKLRSPEVFLTSLCFQRPLPIERSSWVLALLWTIMDKRCRGLEAQLMYIGRSLTSCKLSSSSLEGSVLKSSAVWEGVPMRHRSLERVRRRCV